MSRSGYSEDCENLGLWRGAVDKAISGRRGQALLREMAGALDAMPVKELIAEDIVRGDGHVCAIGAVAKARGLDVSNLDSEDGEAVGQALGVASALARELAYVNDEEGSYTETPGARWERVRSWVARHIAAPKGT